MAYGALYVMLGFTSVTSFDSTRGLILTVVTYKNITNCYFGYIIRIK